MKKAQYTKAIALSYNGEAREVPSIAAKGHYLSADTIVSLANRYGIPVVENGVLATELDNVPCESSIPENLYEVVAILFNELEKTFSSKK